MQLIGFLQAGKGQSASALAALCEVSRRTIFRDLEILRQADVPLMFDDAQGRYCIPGMYFLPPTNFTAEEALAVTVLCYELGGNDRLPFYRAALSAALKLESSLPGALRQQVRETTGGVEIRLEPRNPLDGQQSNYRQLLHAIARGRAVRIRYDSFSEATEIHTKLSPYRLLFSRHSWYVIGRSSLHREVRTFNLGRIASLELLDERFQVPRGFTIERYLGNAWHLIPEPGRDEEVVIRFGKMVARNVAEVAWHKTQRLLRRDDGTLDFHVTVSGLNEISWWILGYGDQAEVLEPARLRDMIAARAVRLVETYDVKPAQ